MLTFLQILLFELGSKVFTWYYYSSTLLCVKGSSICDERVRAFTYKRTTFIVFWINDCLTLTVELIHYCVRFMNRLTDQVVFLLGISFQ